MVKANQVRTIAAIRKTVLITLLLASMALIILMTFLVYTNAVEKIDLSIFWCLVYVTSIVFIIVKFRNGLFFDPMFVLPSAYFFILVVGSLLFHWIEQRDYSVYASNLIGVGYLSLIIGLLLSSTYLYRFVGFKIIKPVPQPCPLKNKLIINLFIIIH